MKGKIILILVLSLAAVGALYAVEQFIEAGYILKTSLKIFLLLVVPLLISILFFRSQASRIAGIQDFRFSSLVPGVVVGILSFVIILAAYAVLGSLVDFPGIVANTESKLGITPANFIFVGLYVIFINSLLEEYFFRGFVFLNLLRRMPAWAAYGFSAGLFAVYHVAIIKGWFTPALTVLALLSLFVIGLVFNFLNSRSGHFLNSWIAHAIADSALILIGLRMFGLI